MKKILTFMTIAAAACLAACSSSDDDSQPQTAGIVKIDPVITRATATDFEDNDQIGLTITKTGGSVYADNQLMTYAGGVFTSSLTWYTEGNDESELTAYYPYDSAGAPSSFTVKSDQTSTGYAESDFLAASKSGVLPTTNSISMVFKHMMSNIIIKTTNETGSDITSVVLKGAIPTATIDISELIATVDETAAAVDIKAQQVTTNTTYRAIVVPQTVAFTLEVTTASGKVLSQRLNSTVLLQSKEYTINARILPDDIVVTISGGIENWSDGGEIGEDNTVIEFEEYEGYFIYYGVTYPTVTFSNGSTWMAAPLRYLPDGYTPSSDPTDENHIWYPYSTDGTITTALTDAESIASLGYLYDTYVAFNNTEVTEANCATFEGIQGICPDGWHIPTRADYFDLCGLSNKDDSGTETGNQINTNAVFYDSNYGSGKITLANEMGFNYVFSGTMTKTNFTATSKYQATVTKDTTCSVEEWLGLPALNYYMTSTVYKPIYSSSDGSLTNIQFFGLMSTFTTAYTEGRLSLAYVSTMSGQQIRCVKD